MRCSYPGGAAPPKPDPKRIRDRGSCLAAQLAKAKVDADVATRNAADLSLDYNRELGKVIRLRRLVLGIADILDSQGVASLAKRAARLREDLQEILAGAPSG